MLPMLSPGSRLGITRASFTGVSVCLPRSMMVSSDDRSITDAARSYIRRTKLVWHYESTQDRGDVAVCGARPTRHPARRVTAGAPPGRGPFFDWSGGWSWGLSRYRERMHFKVEK
jgi:hypothetical protein